jgi:hypothetical protein
MVLSCSILHGVSNNPRVGQSQLALVGTGAVTIPVLFSCRRQWSSLMIHGANVARELRARPDLEGVAYRMLCKLPTEILDCLLCL